MNPLRYLLILGIGFSGSPAIAPALAAQGQEAARSDSASVANALAPTELNALTAQVAAQLRCPVCRNQSVLESSAELARRMQSVIRERLAAGESPEQVKAYFVARYGEWILLKPRARGANLAVYLLPPLLLLLGALLVRNRLRIWRRDAEERSRRGEGNPQHVGGVTWVAPAGLSPDEASRQADAADAEELTEADEEWLREAIRQE